MKIIISLFFTLLHSMAASPRSQEMKGTHEE